MGKLNSGIDSFDDRLILVETTGCLVYQRGGKKKYATISVRGRDQYAHRYAWERVHGPIPAGQCVMHSCDNPRCVRIEHLSLGSQRENMNDMARKGRAAKGSGHYAAKLDEAKVVEIRRLVAAGLATQSDLAARFGVSRNTIRQTLTGRSWRA